MFQAAKSTSDGILRLDLDMVDNGPPTFDSTISESDNLPPQKETPKPPMPPTKPTGTKESQDAENSVSDQEHKTPLPPDQKLKEGLASKDDVNAKEKDSVSREENVEESKAPGEENREKLAELSSKGTSKPPVPLPKNVPDKLKVAWDQPVSELENTEDLKSSGDGSKDSPAETAAADVTKPPAPPPKILSEKMLATMNSSHGDLEAGGLEDLGSGSSEHPVNGIEGSEVAESTSPTAEPKEENGTSLAEKEQQSSEQTPSSLAAETGQESVKETIERKTSIENTSGLKLRSSSLGDLLSDSKNTQTALPGQSIRKDSHHCLAKMEEKVASEREKAEKLLQKVLRGGLEQVQEGNGPPVMAETLLNEAVEQLRQATQVLQEIKGLGELKKEATQKQKEKQKDLVTLYRRSAP